jgi:protein TonB
MMKRRGKLLFLMFCVSVLIHLVLFMTVPGIFTRTPIPLGRAGPVAVVNLSLFQVEEESPDPIEAAPSPSSSLPMGDLNESVETYIPVDTLEEPAPAAAESAGTSSAVSAADFVASSKNNSAVGALRDSLLARYAETLHRRINSRKEYPVQARRQRQTGTVQVRFVLSRQGLLMGEPLLEIKSPHDRLNESAIQAVRRAAPFPAFPSGIQDSEMTFLIEISFSLR